MIEYQGDGSVESVRCKLERTGETKARVVIDVLSWFPDHDFPNLLSMLKTKVSVRIVQLEKSE